MERRLNIRYNPDENALAELNFLKNAKKHQKIGMLINESYSGCSIILTGNILIDIGDNLIVKVGKLEIKKAQVRWVEQLDKNVYKVGIEYQDDK